jgi:hypothetical protein
MRRSKILILFFIAVLLVSSCIKPFDPSIDSKDVNKFVVSGQILDRGGDQVVSVSMSSSINNPKTRPVKGCKVKVLDDKGNEFPMGDSGDGNYHVWIDSIYLTPGAAFKIDVVTPEGIHISSDFDRISECPPVDSIYFIRKDLPTIDPSVTIKGIQFYCNLDGRNTNSRYYRMEAVETWEYHADYPLEWWYDGGTEADVHHVFPPDYSRFVCWDTYTVQNIYTLSTENLIENRYNLFPLNFVDNHTSRLVWGYSLLINQYALSEAAYTYWDQLRINSSIDGGLYNKQPLAIKGNLHNISNSDQDVLGFFGVASIKSKRIFVRDVQNLELEYVSTCVPHSPGPRGLEDISPLTYPAFLMSNGHGFELIVLSPECVNCLALGGTNVKPDFWPY